MNVPQDPPYWLQALALICYVTSGFVLGTVLVAVLK